jgi:hypothetical protein
MYARWIRLLPVRAIGLVSLLLIFSGAAALAQDISGPALQQIGDILAQKARFTPAQKKVSSQLVFAAKAARSELSSTSIADVIPPVPTDPQGKVTVDIRGVITPSLMNQIQSVGGQVMQQSGQWGSALVSLPLGVYQDTGIPAVFSAPPLLLSLRWCSKPVPTIHPRK